MQWYSNQNAAITADSYRLRPSNTTGVRSAALMAPGFGRYVAGYSAEAEAYS